jgi:hypothetical protein
MGAAEDIKKKKQNISAPHSELLRYCETVQYSKLRGFISTLDLK